MKGRKGKHLIFFFFNFTEFRWNGLRAVMVNAIHRYGECHSFRYCKTFPAKHFPITKQIQKEIRRWCSVENKGKDF